MCRHDAKMRLLLVFYRQVLELNTFFEDAAATAPLGLAVSHLLV
jgi:hypothetical protein